MLPTVNKKCRNFHEYAKVSRFEFPKYYVVYERIKVFFFIQNIIYYKTPSKTCRAMEQSSILSVINSSAMWIIDNFSEQTMQL